MKTQRRLPAILALSLLAALGAVACSGAASEPVVTSTSTVAPQTSDAAAPTLANINTPGPKAPDTPTSEPTSKPEEVAVSEIAARSEDDKLAPELKDVSSWINSEPFTLESQRGKVVLIDFWTYTCVNCIRTLPYIKEWHEKYAGSGLVILGVHTPEFDFEKDRDNVLDAVQEFNIEYPVAQDNDFGTWRNFENRFWPAKYLIDKDGYIRYTHFGEGSYAETEQVIRDLLEEAGSDLSEISDMTDPEPGLDSNALTNDPAKRLTRELYAGYERNYGALQSGSTPPYILHREYYEEIDATIVYNDPGEHENQFLYLQGLWLNEAERLVHARQTNDFEDYLALKFFATSVNAVMAPETDGESYTVRLTIDDKPLTPEQAGFDVMFGDDGDSYVLVDESRMYNLINLALVSGNELKLSSNSDEFALFAFTFGAYAGGEPSS